MRDYYFELVLDCELDDDQLEKLYKRFGSHLGTSRSCGKECLTFDVSGRSFQSVLFKYIKDVEKLLPNVKVIQVRPDDSVTIKDIADRCGTTRQRINNYAKGTRGEGFPQPSTETSDKIYYSWAEVAEWLSSKENIKPLMMWYENDLNEIIILNSLLKARQHIPTKKKFEEYLDKLPMN